MAAISPNFDNLQDQLTRIANRGEGKLTLGSDGQIYTSYSGWKGSLTRSYSLGYNPDFEKAVRPYLNTLISHIAPLANSELKKQNVNHDTILRAARSLMDLGILYQKDTEKKEFFISTAKTLAQIAIEKFDLGKTPWVYSDILPERAE